MAIAQALSSLRASHAHDEAEALGRFHDSHTDWMAAWGLSQTTNMIVASIDTDHDWGGTKGFFIGAAQLPPEQIIGLRQVAGTYWPWYSTVSSDEDPGAREKSSRIVMLLLGEGRWKPAEPVAPPLVAAAFGASTKPSEYYVLRHWRPKVIGYLNQDVPDYQSSLRLLETWNDSYQLYAHQLTMADKPDLHSLSELINMIEGQVQQMHRRTALNLLTDSDTLMRSIAEEQNPGTNELHGVLIGSGPMKDY